MIPKFFYYTVDNILADRQSTNKFLFKNSDYRVVFEMADSINYTSHDYNLSL